MIKKEQFHPFDLLALVIGSVVGFGSFVLPGSSFLPESGVLSTVIAMLLGGLMVVFIQAGYAIMLQEQQEDGGEFSYTYRHRGKTHGFIVGWGLALCYLSIVPLNATAFPIIFKLIFPSLESFGVLYHVAGYAVTVFDILMSSAVIAIFAAINIAGIKQNKRVQNVLILLLVSIVSITFVLTLIYGDRASFASAYMGAGSISWAKILPVVAVVPFLFVGFDVIDQVVTDIGFSRIRAVFIGLIGIFFGVGMYSMLTVVTGMTNPDAAAAGALPWALGAGVYQLFGPVALLAITVAMLCAVTSGINGFLLSSSRLFGALADYGMLPPAFGEKNKHGANDKSILFVSAVSLIAPWVGREVLNYIVDMSSLLAALAYFYVCMISFNNTSIRWLRPIILVGAGMSLLFMGILIWPSSPAFLGRNPLIFLVAWIALGFFYYRRYAHKLV